MVSCRQPIDIIAVMRGVIGAVEILQCLDVECAKSTLRAILQRWIGQASAIPPLDIGHHCKDALVLPIKAGATFVRHTWEATSDWLISAVMWVSQAKCMPEFVD